MSEKIRRDVIKPPELTEPETIEYAIASTGQYGPYVQLMLTHNKVIYYNQRTVGYKILSEMDLKDLIGKSIVSEKRVSQDGQREYFVPKIR